MDRGSDSDPPGPVESALTRAMRDAPSHCYVALDAVGKNMQLEIVGVGETPAAALEAARRAGSQDPLVVWSPERSPESFAAGNSGTA
jgi:hypothetical protein